MEDLNKKRWTSNEINFLKNNHKEFSTEQLGLILNRSYCAVRFKLYSFNLKKDFLFENLLNKRFGKLFVIKLIIKNKKTKQLLQKDILWKCKCDCGKTKLISHRNLLSYCSNSCGCLKLDNRFKTIENITFNTHKVSAIERDLVSYLNKEQFLKIAYKKCVYCGSISTRKSKHAKLKLNSVDRKNNEPYYKLSNSQSTCFICQKMKLNLLHRVFVKHVFKINKFRKGS